MYLKQSFKRDSPLKTISSLSTTIKYNLAEEIVCSVARVENIFDKNISGIKQRNDVMIELFDQKCFHER